MKVEESEWSDKFSLDTVGSTGTVNCKFRSNNLEVLTCNSLCTFVTNLIEVIRIVIRYFYSV